MGKRKSPEVVDLTVVVDRSRSMAAIKDEAEGGLNHFFESQNKEAPGTRLTLVQFDTEYEFVHEDVPIGDVPKYELIPRGMTALLDAAGKAAAQAIERLKNLPEKTKAIFAVITDGQENSSREWTKGKLRTMLDSLQEKGCQVIFLGANIDAFAEGGAIGTRAANTANYSATPKGTRAAYAAVVSNAAAYSKGLTDNMAFSDAQRSAMNDDGTTIQTPADSIPQTIDASALNDLRRSRGLSWSGLEREAGLGNATLKRYADGSTSNMSETTKERLCAAFPELLQH